MPEVAEDGSITIDLQIERSRLSEPPGNDARPDADAVGPRTLSAMTRVRVRIEAGQAVVPGGVVQSSAAGSDEQHAKVKAILQQLDVKAP